MKKTDKRFRGLAVAAAFASLFSYAIILCITPASINEIARFYDASGAQLGWLYRIMMLGFFVTVIAGGRYSDRTGKLPVMLLGCVLMGAGAYVFSSTSSFAGAIAAMALMGMGGGMAEGLATAIVSDLYGGARRTAMLNYSQVVFAVGAVSSPLAVAWLLDLGVNWRVGYIGAAVFCVISALVVLLAGASGREKPLRRHGDSISWRKLLSDRLVFWLSAGILLYVGAECGQAHWLAAYFEGDLGSTAPLAASSVALFWFGISAGRVVAAWSSKRMSDFSLICWSLSLGAVSQASLLLVQTPGTALVAVLALGFFLGPVWPTILSRAGAAHPMQSGTVFGIVIASGALGAAIFPPGVGMAADVVGMRAALWSCFAILVLNLGIFLRMKMRSQKTVPSNMPG